VYETLYEYDWPGNVRELQNVLRSYLVMGRIDLAGSTRPRANRVEISASDGASTDLDLHTSVADLEKRLIIKALDQERGHRGRAAVALGIDRKTLFRKMKRYWPMLPQ
jgi:DNA-binding NtrC family response regulator